MERYPRFVRWLVPTDRLVENAGPPTDDLGASDIAPIFAELTGLAPLIIQAGSHEVLLDDAIRLARQAATADVEVTLDITPGVPHVFQVYYPMLDEAAAALDRAGQLLSAYLVSAERVTASQRDGG